MRERQRQTKTVTETEKETETDRQRQREMAEFTCNRCLLHVQENRIDASDQILPKEILPLLDEVHNSKLWLRLLWEDKYWTLAHHLLCPEVQVG